jgi:hypothetical protein
MTAVINADNIALAYTRVVCAYWRGDNEFLGELEAWFARFWADCPPEPSTKPTAVCPHGAAGRGIHWYDTTFAVLGHVPGKRKCYRIPRATVLPAFTDEGQAIAMDPVAA